MSTDITKDRCKRVYFAHNGERSRYESAWTWICSCGESESGSTKAVALDEWRWHKGINFKARGGIQLMKLTKRHKDDEKPVLALEESDREEAIKIGEQAEEIWHRKWAELGKKSHGSCCGGKGIKVWFRGKGKRYAKPTFVARCDWVQGNLAAQESKDDALAYVKEYLADNAFYDDGYMI